MTSQKNQAPLLGYIAVPVLPDDVMKECIPLNDGNAYFDDSTNPHELQVRCNGQVYDVQLPVQVSRGCFANGNTVHFSGNNEGEPRQYYTALFTPGQGITISHLRNELKDETLCKLGLVHRKTSSGDVLYRIYDDPCKGILIDTNSAVKKKLKGKIICVRPTSAERDPEVSVRKIVKSENILDVAIKVPDASLAEWNSFAYAHDSSRFCYISDGKMLFVLETDSLTMLAPLRFSNEIEVSSITGVQEGIITVNGIDLALRYYSRSAKLPEGYFGNTTANFKQSTAPGSCDEEFESLFLRNFKPTVLLGTGGYGCVFKVTSLREYELDSEYAVKRIPIQGSKEEMDKILEEACALSGLEHPGIVDYIRSWTEKPPKHWQRSADNKLMKRFKGFEDQCDYGDDAAFLYIQTELCGSTLYRRLDYERRHNIEPVLKRMKSWFKQLLEAVAYLHDNNKIHRDLKPSNILMAGEDHLKICDLGFVAERIISNGTGQDQKRKGNNVYMAPEQANPNQFTNKLKYGSMVDQFALGLIFAELCVRFPDEETKDEVFKSYRKQRPLDDRPAMQHLPDVDSLICKLTNRDPKERPSCKEILQFPIILELDYVRL